MLVVEQYALETLHLAVWLALLGVLFVPLERLFTAAPQRVLRKEFGTDLAYYFGNSLLVTPLIALPAAIIGISVYKFLPWQYRAMVGDLPTWSRLLAIFIVSEVGFYWAHRWTHEVPLLWKFHSIHHSAEEMDWLTNTRAHPVDLVFTRVVGFVPMYALGLVSTGRGADLATPALVVIVGTLWGFLIHANIKWRFGILESVIATPAFHRWHHTNCEFRDRNYASMLPLLDRLFGTFHTPRATLPAALGVDAPVPSTVLGQLAHPLRSSSRPAGQTPAI